MPGGIHQDKKTCSHMNPHRGLSQEISVCDIVFGLINVELFYKEKKNSWSRYNRLKPQIFSKSILMVTGEKDKKFPKLLLPEDFIKYRLVRHRLDFRMST